MQTYEALVDAPFQLGHGDKDEALWRSARARTSTTQLELDRPGHAHVLRRPRRGRDARDLPPEPGLHALHRGPQARRRALRRQERHLGRLRRAGRSSRTSGGKLSIKHRQRGLRRLLRGDRPRRPRRGQQGQDRQCQHLRAPSDARARSAKGEIPDARIMRRVDRPGARRPTTAPPQPAKAQG
jgi:hypothetical protein